MPQEFRQVRDAARADQNYVQYRPYHLNRAGSTSGTHPHGMDGGRRQVSDRRGTRRNMIVLLYKRRIGHRRRRPSGDRRRCKHNTAPKSHNFLDVLSAYAQAQFLWPTDTDFLCHTWLKTSPKNQNTFGVCSQNTGFHHAVIHISL